MPLPDLNALSLPHLFEALIAEGSLDRLLAAAQAEDFGEQGDVTTEAMIGRGWVVRANGGTRAQGVVCGLAAIGRTLDAFDCTARVDLYLSDGQPCLGGQIVFSLLGEVGEILGVERTLLNLLGRLSGIATLTARYVEAVKGTGALICDTRKTTPGMRSLEKYAVRCGGGTLHRLGLHDAVLLKDNHLAHLCPGELLPAVSAAVRKARARHELRFVEVEVERLEQLAALLDAPPGLIDIVLLDNMDLPALHQAVEMRDEARSACALEASGGINLDSVREVAETGVDRISVGALTHSAPWLDVSMYLT